MTEALMDETRRYWVDANNRSYDPLQSRARWNLTSVVNATVNALVERGIDRSWIQVGRDARLPGSFGLGKTHWDIVITKGETPLGAIEFTTLPGLSASKNLANRIHDLTSRAVSVRSHDHGGPEPLLGLFIMLEQGESINVQPRLEEALNQFHNDEFYDEIAYTSYVDEPLLRQL
ncbi:PaeR7I family type II restriction endonuclease [Streptomyces sp. NPDC049910]|uniref:PaeR7I family type II restriction endonuclease n=1 Tax=Streptomyces sp. NPDC049910 TaxID=3155278 RepID=UPI0034248B6D